MVRDQYEEPALREAIGRFDEVLRQVDAVAGPEQRRLLDHLRHDQLRYVADAVIVGRLRPGADADDMTAETLVEYVRSATADLSAFLTERDDERLADAAYQVDRALLGVGAIHSLSPPRGSHRRAEGDRAMASAVAADRSRGAPGSGMSAGRTHGRHAKRSVWPVLAFVAVALVVAVLVSLVALGTRGNDSSDATSAASECTELQVVAPASYQPALDAVTDDFEAGSTCVELEVTVADGRAAEQVADEEQAHVWITDDASWLELHEATDEAYAEDEESEGPAYPTLATSPVLFVSSPDMAASVERAGGGWTGLATLVESGRPVQVVSADPATSGDGLVALGGLGDSIWDSEGMDASALLLERAYQQHRTVQQFGGATLAADEIALVPEHLLGGDVASANTVTVPEDHTALMRYSWHPTDVDVDSTELEAARSRLLTTLTEGATADAARGAAYLRDAKGRVPPTWSTGGAWVDRSLPPSYPVMDAHRVSHVFATWYAKDRLADVLVVIDVSGSMAEPAPGSDSPLIDLVRDNVRQLAGQLPADARLGVWGFGSQLVGQRDYVAVAPLRALTSAHRARLDASLDGLVAQPTGTGLHDTLVAAYRSALDSVRPGVRFDVMVFTDGLNQDDPGSRSAGDLRRALARVADPDAPVGLTVVKVGDDPAGSLERALAPVGGEIVEITDAEDVVATFIHLAAGGLHE